MRNFIIKVVVNALALWLTALVYRQGVYFQGEPDAFSALLAGLVLGLVNALIRPVLLLLALPLNLLTLGLFTLVVNAVVLLIVAGLTRLNVADFSAAVVGALVLTVVSWLLDVLLERAFRVRSLGR